MLSVSDALASICGLTFKSMPAKRARIGLFLSTPSSFASLDVNSKFGSPLSTYASVLRTLPSGRMKPSSTKIRLWSIRKCPFALRDFACPCALAARQPIIMVMFRIGVKQNRIIPLNKNGAEMNQRRRRTSPCWLRVSVGRELLHAGHDFVRIDHPSVLKRWRERNRRNVRASYADDWAVQIVESLFRDNGGNLAAYAQSAFVFMNDEALVCPANGLENRFAVERRQRAQIDHFRFNASFLRHFFRSLEAQRSHIAIGDNRHVTAAAARFRFADRHSVIAIGNFAFRGTVKFFVLKIQHWIRIADRC